MYLIYRYLVNTIYFDLFNLTVEEKFQMIFKTLLKS